MMRKMVLLVPLVIFGLINQSFSAMFWEFEHTDMEESDYTISRNASPYRGFFLSLSDAEKNEMCKDLYYTQFYRELDHEDTEDTTDSVSTSTEREPSPKSTHPVQMQEPPNPVIVADFSFPSEPHNLRKELVIKCELKNFPHKPPRSGSTWERPYYHMSSAFRTNWMYLVHPMGNPSIFSQWGNPRNPYLVILYYLGLSPVHVEMEQAKLEQRYVEIRRKMKTLAQESSKYVQLIEKKDDFSALGKWQKLDLCASVMSSRAYQKEGEGYLYSWILGDKPDLKNELKSLSFNDDRYHKEDWKADCVYCEGWIRRDKGELDLRHFYLTRTYDDENAIITLIVKNGGIFLDKYFKNVHIFINARERVPYHTLTRRYDEMHGIAV